MARQSGASLELKTSFSATRNRARLPIFSASQAITFVLLAVGGAVMLFPFLWMVFSAFKPAAELVTYPPMLLPSNPTLATLERVWNAVDFAKYFANSMFATVSITLIELFTSALVGFVFAKYQFFGRNVLFIGILATMMVPWPVLLIPQYVVALSLGMLNTRAVLIVPYLYSSFGVFLMRQFMHSIPDELMDAARIDGASEPLIFARVVLPLTGPALAALGIFTFMGQWDSFVWPLITLSNENLYTLPIGLATFVGPRWSDQAAINAGTFITIIPVVIVFLLLQRRFIEGIALTGLRG
jgi:multiple sugar transport system permease protein